MCSVSSFKVANSVFTSNISKLRSFTAVLDGKVPPQSGKIISVTFGDIFALNMITALDYLAIHQLVHIMDILLLSKLFY